MKRLLVLCSIFIMACSSDISKLRAKSENLITEIKNRDGVCDVIIDNKGYLCVAINPIEEPRESITGELIRLGIEYGFKIGEIKGYRLFNCKKYSVGKWYMDGVELPYNETSNHSSTSEEVNLFQNLRDIFPNTNLVKIENRDYLVIAVESGRKPLFRYYYKDSTIGLYNNDFTKVTKKRIINGNLKPFQKELENSIENIITRKN